MELPTSTDFGFYLHELQKLANQVRTSVHDVKTFSFNLHKLCMWLPVGPCGRYIDYKFSDENKREAIALREDLAPLVQTIDTVRDGFYNYLLNNAADAPIMPIIMHKLGKEYPLCKSTYEKFNNIDLIASSVERLYRTLYGVIMTLAAIEMNNMRPYKQLISQYGIIHDDGKIERLEFVELFLEEFQCITKPVLKHYEYSINNKWGIIVGFYFTDYEDFVRKTGADLLNSHVQSILEYVEYLFEKSKLNTEEETCNEQQFSKKNINLKFNDETAELLITRGETSHLINPPKGGLGLLIVKAMFPKVRTKGISMDEILNKVHSKLGCQDNCQNKIYSKACKDKVDSTVRRYCGQVEIETSGEFKNLIKRANNVFTIDYSKLLRQNI